MKATDFLISVGIAIAVNIAAIIIYNKYIKK